MSFEQSSDSAVAESQKTPSHSPSQLMAITSRPSNVMVRGFGSYLWDAAGARYLDFIQGWAVNSLGHAAPEIVSALADQASSLISPSPALHNLPQLELADLLVRGSEFAQVHFLNSGAEANEAAVKLARKWGQSHKPNALEIITTENAFHGRTLAMMSASGKPGWAQMFPPMPAGFQHVPFGDIEAMQAAVGPRTLAIMVEPIQGEAGVVIPPPGYLRELRALADAQGALLIFDEVQTGIGRTGLLYAHQHDSVVPDIMTLGKGIGGGVPLAAVMAKASACCFEFGDQGGTYNGNPLMTAVGRAVVETITAPGFLAEVRQREIQLRSGLETLAQRYQWLEVRGQGLLYAVKLPSTNSAAICERAFAKGLLINPARPNVLRFMPSLRVSSGEIREMLERLEACL